LRGCFDFAILIRSVHLLQQIFKSAILASNMLPELQVFLHLMLDLTNAERSLWQRATSLEFLRSICEDSSTVAVLYKSGPGADDQRLFSELTNALSKLMHQVCFSSGGIDSNALQSVTNTTVASAASRVAGHESRLSGQGVSILDRAGLLSQASMPNFPGAGAGGDGGNPGGRANRSQVRLLLLMNETEPPPIQPAFLVSLVVESVFALVSSIYRLLLATEEGPSVAEEATENTPVEHKLVRAGSAPDGPFPGGRLSPLPELSAEQEVCKGMLQDSWASLLSAVSLLLHGTSDAGLQQALRCLQTLLYCCSRLSLDQARDACLLQFSRYAWPNENEGPSTPTSKNLLCFKALVNFCYRYGGLLAEPGWTIALRAFQCLERTLQKAPAVPNSDLATLRQALDSMFETTSLLPDHALMDVVGALGRNLRTTSDVEEGSLILNRMVELCNFNLARLFVVWDSVLGTITEVCTSDDRAELKSLAATALCRILEQALRKGALAMAEKPEEAQDELLRHLEVLLRSQHDYTRARICEGLLSILQTSGQELQPTAWGTMIRLISTAASVELQRAGIDFYLEEDVLRPEKSESLRGSGGEGKEVAASAALPTVFQLLELLVHDFMENVPQSSLPHLTASIGAMARYTGLGVNSSLTAVGFLWNVADALARYHCAEEDDATKVISFAELWAHIFLQLRALASDHRPEVRNCAVKSLATALLSHGCKVGLACYQRCLSDILLKVLTEIQAARNAGGNSRRKSENLIVHHSRDTPEKQWDETLALAFDGVRRVLSHFSEQAGAKAFAPLAYAMLLQVQETLRTLGSETSTSAIRALVDLMRIPSAIQMFEVELLTVDPRLPPGDVTMTSVWLLGWRVLWRLLCHCMSRELPENLIESFTASMAALRSSHSHCFSPAQHLILLQFSLVMSTIPSWYLPSATPWLEASEDEDDTGGADALLAKNLEKAGFLQDKELIDFIQVSPDKLWDLQLRTENQAEGGPVRYTKAATATSAVVASNSSRSQEIWTCAATWQAETPEEPQMLSARCPTHRTMLHVSSARLQHVQGIAYSFIEETCNLGSVEAIFLCQLCAVFLDGRRIVDSNKLALAVRSLCVLILFCRRSFMQMMTGQGGNGELSVFITEVIPMLCQVLAKLICYKGRINLHHTCLWKLAMEALFYIVEDSLLSLEHCDLEVDDRYWDVMASTFSKVAEVLQLTHDDDVSLLSQVFANLLMQRLLVCTKTPLFMAERAVGLLQVLVRDSGMGSASLRHFFALCETEAEEEMKVESEDTKLSVAAATAKGVQAPVARIPLRTALLGTTAPALVDYVRNLFSRYLQEEEARQRGGSASSALHRAQEVRLALNHLQRLDADEAVVSVVAPRAEKAQMACQLAGKKGLVMALLPQLSALAPSGDPEVRKLVREVLQELAAHLQLT